MTFVKTALFHKAGEGSGGGGGGAVNSVNGKTGNVVLNAKDVHAVPQLSTMPAADGNLHNAVVQYIGETIIGEHTQRIQGFFYRNVPGYINPYATVSQTVGSTLSNLDVDTNQFYTHEWPTGNGTFDFTYVYIPSSITLDNSRKEPDTFEITSINADGVFAAIRDAGLNPEAMDLESTVIYYDPAESKWFIDPYIPPEGSMGGVDIDSYITYTGTLDPINASWIMISSMVVGMQSWTENGNPIIITDYGVTYSGTPNDGDVLTVEFSADSVVYSWWPISVQAGDLPDTTDHYGQFLKVDIDGPSWSPINALQNNTSNTNGLAILGSVTGTCSNATAVGASAEAQNNNTTAIGYNTKAESTSCTAIGSSADAFRMRSTAIGFSAHTGGNDAVCVGSSATTSDVNSDGMVAIGGLSGGNGDGAVAIGYGAKVGATGAIQISSRYGNINTNSDAYTFKVANRNGNFMIMNANGNLPADRLASTTGLADGNYRLRLTMASGVPTLSWVAE